MQKVKAEKKPVLVIGAGSWGTALAIHLARGGFQVFLWGRNTEQLQHMQQCSENKKYLPGIILPKSIHVISELSQAIINQVGLVLCSVPSAGFVEVCQQLSRYELQDSIFCWASKGMTTYQGKTLFLQQVVEDKLKDIRGFAIISGPSFAKEVALNKPTAVVCASNKKEVHAELLDWFHHSQFRVYFSDDLLGVQLCGVMKNIIAVASGVVDGMDLGCNARSAVLTRSIAEMSTILMAAGGKKSTLFGLAGIGDIILTSTSTQSRNYRLGLALGKGETLSQAVKFIGQATESVDNVSLLMEMAAKYKVEMPITEQVFNLFSGKVKVNEILPILFARESQYELVD